jgi:hypothetical protein
MLFLCPLLFLIGQPIPVRVLISNFLNKNLKIAAKKKPPKNISIKNTSNLKSIMVAASKTCFETCAANVHETGSRHIITTSVHRQAFSRTEENSAEHLGQRPLAINLMNDIFVLQ